MEMLFLEAREYPHTCGVARAYLIRVVGYARVRREPELMELATELEKTIW